MDGVEGHGTSGGRGAVIIGGSAVTSGNCAGALNQYRTGGVDRRPTVHDKAADTTAGPEAVIIRRAVIAHGDRGIDAHPHRVHIFNDHVAGHDDFCRISAGHHDQFVGILNGQVAGAHPSAVHRQGRGIQKDNIVSHAWGKVDITGFRVITGENNISGRRGEGSSIARRHIERAAVGETALNIESAGIKGRILQGNNSTGGDIVAAGIVSTTSRSIAAAGVVQAGCRAGFGYIKLQIGAIAVVGIKVDVVAQGNVAVAVHLGDADIAARGPDRETVRNCVQIFKLDAVGIISCNRAAALDKGQAVAGAGDGDVGIGHIHRRRGAEMAEGCFAHHFGGAGLEDEVFSSDVIKVVTAGHGDILAGECRLKADGTAAGAAAYINRLGRDGHIPGAVGDQGNLVVAVDGPVGDGEGLVVTDPHGSGLANGRHQQVGCRTQGQRSSRRVVDGDFAAGRSDYRIDVANPGVKGVAEGAGRAFRPAGRAKEGAARVLAYIVKLDPADQINCGQGYLGIGALRVNVGMRIAAIENAHAGGGDGNRSCGIVGGQDAADHNILVGGHGHGAGAGADQDAVGHDDRAAGAVTITVQIGGHGDGPGRGSDIGASRIKQHIVIGLDGDGSGIVVNSGTDIHVGSGITVGGDGYRLRADVVVVGSQGAVDVDLVAGDAYCAIGGHRQGGDVGITQALADQDVAANRGDCADGGGAGHGHRGSGIKFHVAAGQDIVGRMQDAARRRFNDHIVAGIQSRGAGAGDIHIIVGGGDKDVVGCGNRVVKSGFILCVDGHIAGMGLNHVHRDILSGKGNHRAAQKRSVKCGQIAVAAGVIIGRNGQGAEAGRIRIGTNDHRRDINIVAGGNIHITGGGDSAVDEHIKRINIDIQADGSGGGKIAVNRNRAGGGVDLDRVVAESTLVGACFDINHIDVANRRQAHTTGTRPEGIGIVIDVAACVVVLVAGCVNAISDVDVIAGGGEGGESCTNTHLCKELSISSTRIYGQVLCSIYQAIEIDICAGCCRSNSYITTAQGYLVG